MIGPVPVERGEPGVQSGHAIQPGKTVRTDAALGGLVNMMTGLVYSSAITLLTAVSRLAIVGLACGLLPMPAQVVLSGTGPNGQVHIHSSDLAVFVAEEDRNDLPCAVSPNKPMLGFDLRFHTSYEVAVPLRELSGSYQQLTILFRVVPRHEDAETVYFTQRIRVPPIEEEAKGDAYLQGSFDVGEGEYDVGWLMRDQAGRVCSQFWDINAHLAGKDQQIDLDITPWEVRQSDPEQFKNEPPVIRTSDSGGLNVKVMVNFAPQNPHSATLQPSDTSALIAILRSISREPRIGKFSLVAFNLHEQRVIYEQKNADRIDFPALGESLDTLELGTIDLQRLSEKHGETEFLSELMRRELENGEKPDALIFAGPKAILTRKVAEEDLGLLGELGYPIFYMNYNLYPHLTPWRDTIGNAVKYLKGEEYSITTPRDLWYAVTEMVSGIVKNREVRHAAVTSSD